MTRKWNHFPGCLKFESGSCTSGRKKAGPINRAGSLKKLKREFYFVTHPCGAGARGCAARSGERRKIRELLASAAAKVPLRRFPASGRDNRRYPCGTSA